MSTYTHGSCGPADYNYNDVHFWPLNQRDRRRSKWPGLVSPPEHDGVLCRNGAYHMRYTHVLREVRCAACLEILRKKGYADAVQAAADNKNG